MDSVSIILSIESNVFKRKSQKKKLIKKIHIFFILSKLTHPIKGTGKTNFNIYIYNIDGENGWKTQRKRMINDVNIVQSVSYSICNNGFFSWFFLVYGKFFSR